MNCNEVQQHMGDAIDGVLSTQARADFFSHLHLCGPCRNEYEIETMAKNIVRSKLSRRLTPSDLYHSVVQTVQKELEADLRAPGLLEKIFGGRVLPPAIAGALALIGLFFLSNPLSDSPRGEFTHNASNDVINQSLRNFLLVQSGELRPAMISCYPEVMVGYFRENGFEFAVSLPSMDSCDWYGAISGEYSGVKTAHVIYKRGPDLIYVYQIGKDEVLKGSVLELPASARKALAETGWYTDPAHPDCNVVLWTADDALCAAVSSMKKDRLLALLTTK